MTITISLEKFDAFHAVENAETFIVNDLSNRYVRRIRDRVGPTATGGKDKDDAFQTLWEVLTTYTKLLAPMIPFLAEEIYKNLTDEESELLIELSRKISDLPNIFKSRLKESRKIGEGLMKSSVKHSIKPHKIQRNELCSCGSGKKFKKCCAQKLN